MKRTKLLQEYLMLRFEEEDAARLLGVSDRTFRRYLIDYEAEGLQKSLRDGAHYMYNPLPEI